MKVQVRAAEATLELGLADLKKQCEATAQWLRRLGAGRVAVGEPTFADQVGKDPMQQAMRAARALRGRPATPAAVPKREVAAVLTATWEIAAMSVEQVLVLVDRLRFEAAGDAAGDEGPEELPPWASPEEQMQRMMAQIHQPPPEDRGPHFLFVARLGDDQLEKAYAGAFTLARRQAERLARAAGMRLGALATIHASPGLAGAVRHNQLVDQQRCLGILADCDYNLADDEVASDDPRPIEFPISVNVSYYLESAVT
jgi:hypothetical protein